MKYKVGDKVRIKSFDWYNENRDKIGQVDCGCGCAYAYFVPSMVTFCGQIVTISSVQTSLEAYCIKEDGGTFKWTNEMIEGLAEEGIQPLTLGNSWECPQGYQFVDENGNVINAQKIVLEKKKKEYPKTYEECCKELNIAVRDLDILDNMLDTIEIIYYKNLDRLLNSFRKLLICRDAYWKIAGEEMGLGKPWGTGDCKIVYGICREKGNIVKRDDYFGSTHTFEFPIREMRDAFYENFKELIENCKELM